MPTVYKDIEVEVDVELGDFDDDELLDEVERRRLGVDFGASTARELVEKIYHLRRQDRDYQTELDQLFWCALGRIV
jgi:hypothetical protein